MCGCIGSTEVADPRLWRGTGPLRKEWSRFTRAPGCRSGPLSLPGQAATPSALGPLAVGAVRASIALMLSSKALTRVETCSAT